MGVTPPAKGVWGRVVLLGCTQRWNKQAAAGVLGMTPAVYPKTGSGTYCRGRGCTHGEGVSWSPHGLRTLHLGWGKHWHALTHVTLCGMWCVQGAWLQPAAPPGSRCTLPLVWGRRCLY